ncbi:hypothetical protein H5410_046910 [Solanum commersonii]|uniref:Uncharacterized protein n=1 Tax=Solanum commersonii TaxID=4109 RepID=A0A9J5XGU1_SOLCO|nr:hypothetical protein H5410_046910 [Solanum commersonii]
MSWVMPSKITEAIQSWEEAGMQSMSRERWRIVPSSIWWAIWKERNSRCFDSIENTLTHQARKEPHFRPLCSELPEFSKVQQAQSFLPTSISTLKTLFDNISRQEEAQLIPSPSMPLTIVFFNLILLGEQGAGTGRNRQGDNWEKVSLIRDKFEYDRERRMREKAFAPMSASNNIGMDYSTPKYQASDSRRYISDSDSDID